MLARTGNPYSAASAHLSGSHLVQQHDHVPKANCEQPAAQLAPGTQVDATSSGFPGSGSVRKQPAWSVPSSITCTQTTAGVLTGRRRAAAGSWARPSALSVGPWRVRAQSHREVLHRWSTFAHRSGHGAADRGRLVRLPPACDPPRTSRDASNAPVLPFVGVHPHHRDVDHDFRAQRGSGDPPGEPGTPTVAVGLVRREVGGPGLLRAADRTGPPPRCGPDRRT